VNFDTHRYVSSVNDFAHASRTGDQIFGSLSFGYEYRKEGCCGRLMDATTSPLTA